MQIDPVQLMKETMAAYGVNALLLKPPYEDIYSFDERLRAQLFDGYDYDEILSRLHKICAEQVVYMVEDQYSVQYIIIALPKSAQENMAFMLIGPYLRKQSEALLQDIMQEEGISLNKVAALKEYYSGIPHVASINAMETQATMLAKYLLGSDRVAVGSVNLRLEDAGRRKDIIEESNEKIHMEIIEERYRNEEDLLKAIELGNQQEAAKHLNGLGRFQMERRFSDPLRNQKNYIIIMNTLMRKAVQRAEVHPAHIDSTSALFARKIEAAQSIEDLTKLVNDMLRKYCLMVKNHSLRRYSKPIQNVLNYLDFHYTEQTSLEALAKVADIHPCYLSSQFKKEVGTTITDYVNQNRIQYAQKLLATTGLAINKIAGMVGFWDENYFTRTFKRHTKKTPTIYRGLYKAPL